MSRCLWVWSTATQVISSSPWACFTSRVLQPVSTSHTAKEESALAVTTWTIQGNTHRGALSNVEGSPQNQSKVHTYTVHTLIGIHTCALSQSYTHVCTLTVIHTCTHTHTVTHTCTLTVIHMYTLIVIHTCTCRNTFLFLYYCLFYFSFTS